MKIVIFGLGSIGRRHAANLMELGECDIYGYDPGDHIMQPTKDVPSLYLGVQMLPSVEAAWELKPDAVLICTPPYTHTALVQEAIRMNCHVFCEKPLATSAKDAAYLAHQAVQYKKVLAVGYQLRFHDLNVARWHDNPTCFRHYQNMSAWPGQYERDTLEEFSHEIDLSVFVNGPVKEVAAFQRGHFCGIRLQHMNCRDAVEIDDSWKGGYVREIIQANEKRWSFNKEENDRAYKDELSAFLKACRGEGWDDRLCSGAEAAHVCKIIEACRVSARDCSVVRL